MPYAIEVAGLRKRYGAVQAVDGVDLRIDEGAVYALLGPNGAGKTTTVEILEGFRARDEGEIRVLGLDPDREREQLLRRVGVVLQQSAPIEMLTAREIIGFTGKMYDDPIPVDEVLELVGMTEHADRRGTKLSGGQMRRVAMAQGIIGRPDLLFLDEPTTGFDPSARQQAWEVIRRITGRGATVLLTTHYLDEAEQLADVVGVISAGKMLIEGCIGQIREQMQSATHVRWRAPDDLDSADLPPQWAAAERANGMIDLATHEPTRAAGELIDWARERGIDELPELAIERPTLEQMYLELVGDAPPADAS